MTSLESLVASFADCIICFIVNLSSAGEPVSDWFAPLQANPELEQRGGAGDVDDRGLCISILGGSPMLEESKRHDLRGSNVGIN